MSSVKPIWNLNRPTGQYIEVFKEMSSVDIPSPNNEKCGTWSSTVIITKISMLLTCAQDFVEIVERSLTGLTFNPNIFFSLGKGN